MKKTTSNLPVTIPLTTSGWAFPIHSVTIFSKLSSSIGCQLNDMHKFNVWLVTLTLWCNADSPIMSGGSNLRS